MQALQVETDQNNCFLKKEDAPWLVKMAAMRLNNERK